MNKPTKCPVCGNDKYKSKEQMLREILAAIGYKKRKPYAYGSMSADETMAIYRWVMGKK